MNKPKNTVIPGLQYRDARAAIEFLCNAFGFERKAVYEQDGKIVHAELTFGNGMIMLGEAHGGEYAKMLVPPSAAGGVTMSTYVIVADADAHCARARAAGAQIVMEPETKPYGRDYTCRDLDGHVWSFGTYDPWQG